MRGAESCEGPSGGSRTAAAVADGCREVARVRHVFPLQLYQ